MAFVSLAPEQRAGTLLTSAKKSHKGLSLHSADLLGTVRARGTPGIEEVCLERTRTSKTYRGHLQHGLAVLLHWVSLSAFAAMDWLGDPLLAHQVLCEFVDHVFRTGGKIGLGRHAILSVQTARRELRGKLGRAWDTIKSWQLKLPLNSRVPMPEVLVRAFFSYSLAEALSCSKDLDVLSAFSFAILVRLAFHCLLRPAELLKLTAADFRLPASAYEPRVAVVRLTDPQNRATLGRFQFAMVEDEELVSWLELFLAGVDGTVKLWPGGADKFGKRFAHTLARLGLYRLPLTPGCLRPGGATRLFLDGISINALKYRGRWRQEGSLEVYIQEAMCHLLSTELSPAEHANIHALLQSSLAQWASPPSSPWSTFFSRGSQWRNNRALPKSCSATRLSLPCARS